MTKGAPVEAGRPRLSPHLEPGVAVPRRSSLEVMRRMAEDPLKSLPAEVYDHRLVVTRNFGRARLFVSDPALIHEVLVGKADALEKSYETKRVLGPALGSGLLTADGAHWRWQRQALAPIFQSSAIASLVPAMIAAGEETRDRWLGRPPGSIIDLGREMMLTTFAIIIETMLSGRNEIDTEAIERSMTDYLEATSYMFALALVRAPRWLPFPGKRRAAAAARTMRASVTRMIAERRREPRGRDDLVALLIAAADPVSGRGLSDAEVADNILTFVTAGHETTALALGWATALLARHPAQEKRMLDEIVEVAGAGPIRSEHIPRLEITRRIVNETLRLYPPAPIIARSVIRDIRLAGIDVPAGSAILVPIHAVHRNTLIWDDPDGFDPDRFDPDRVRSRHRYSFMPFGAGPRICIGATFATSEAVAILAILLKAFRIEPDGRDLPGVRTHVTLRPAVPLRLRVTPR